MMEEYNINQTTLAILGLYRSNYRRACHLREIARDVRVDVKAVQLQVKRLERLSILTSTKRGRNTEYRLNLGNTVTKYFLVLAETFATMQYLAKNFVIKKMIDEVGDVIEGWLVLFGSFAKSEARRGSDIDVMVIAETEASQDAFERVATRMGRNVSPKTASARQFLKGLRQNDPLIREVVANHVVLKGIDQFCEILWRYYAKQ
ncbi:MAG: nucleotidyltransferase domain-containing protein [Candidatus Bathyarchaeia archaeon]